MVIPLGDIQTPTGTIQFQIDGVNFGAPVTLADDEANSGPDSSLTVGTHAVTAVYSGDSTYPGETASLTQTVESTSQVRGNAYTITSLADLGVGTGPYGDLRVRDHPGQRESWKHHRFRRDRDDPTDECAARAECQRDHRRSRPVIADSARRRFLVELQDLHGGYRGDGQHFRFDHRRRACEHGRRRARCVRQYVFDGLRCHWQFCRVWWWRCLSLRRHLFLQRAHDV